MSLLKRHTGRRRRMGRRVAGVGVGVALMVLGLEAPASAAPSVAGFSPASGPVGCVVVITGDNFDNPDVVKVEFNITSADFVVKSRTEIWATVPGGATNGPITVTDSANQTASSTTGFTVTAGPGDCAPTITSFTPTCGPGGTAQTGTDVTITGTNLLIYSGDTSPPAATLGGFVEFAPYTVVATPTAAAPTPTSISVNVPAGALDGPIKVFTFGAPTGLTSTTSFDAGTCITDFQPQSGNVGATVTITGVGFQGATSVKFFNGVEAIFQIATDTETVDTITTTVPFGAATGPITVVTPGGTATTATDFTVGTVVTDHARNISLKLKGSLTMKGKVTVPDGFTDCASGVPVKLQKKKKGGGWNTLKTVTTSDTGAYSGKVKNKPGKYRSVAKKTTAGGETCLKAVSATRKH